ncbi:hypothetical protein D3C80_1225560 [compost metagenome]
MFLVVYNEGFLSVDTSTTLKVIDRLVDRHKISPGTTYVLEFYDLAHMEHLLRLVAEKRISAHDISLTVRGKRVTIEEDGSTPEWAHPARPTSKALKGTNDASDTLRTA